MTMENGSCTITMKPCGNILEKLKLCILLLFGKQVTIEFKFEDMRC